MTASPSTSELETKLEMFAENMRQINIMVADFQPQAQTVLNQKVQKIVTDLKDIEHLKKDVQDIQIPLEVCDYVDGGRNPQVYTKLSMSTTMKKNEEVNGKIESYKKFKAHLLVEMNKYFPKEVDRYRAIRSEEDEEDEEEDDEVEVVENGENGEHEESTENGENAEHEEITENGEREQNGENGEEKEEESDE